MKIRLARIAKYFTAAVFLAGSMVFNVSAQPAKQFGKEVPVSPVGGAAGFTNVCLQVDTMVYNEESLKKLLAFEDCSKMFGGGKIDLKKETLIGWQAGGDCHMFVETKLYRNDQEKLFTFVINNFYGGCRAAGWRHGLFTIEKIPPDYKVKFVEYLVERYNVGQAREASDSGETWTADGQKVPPPPAAATPSVPPAEVPVTPLETREIDIKGCIWLRSMESQNVIKDNETFQQAIRKDASHDRCLKDIEKIDFSKNTLLGINLNTGYCRTPVGLEAKAFRDDAKKLFTLQVSYIEPHGICRAMSSYDLWVLVPKMPEGYEAKFEVKAVKE